MAALGWACLSLSPTAVCAGFHVSRYRWANIWASRWLPWMMVVAVVGWVYGQVLMSFGVGCDVDDSSSSGRRTYWKPGGLCWCWWWLQQGWTGQPLDPQGCMWVSASYGASGKLVQIDLRPQERYSNANSGGLCWVILRPLDGMIKYWEDELGWWTCPQALW